MPYRDPTPDDPRDYVDDQPSPLPAGEFEPDFDRLLDAYLDPKTVSTGDALRAVIAAYRSQQAAHGIVEVRREDLGRILKASGNLNADTWEPIQSAYHRLLAAAKDQER